MLKELEKLSNCRQSEYYGHRRFDFNFEGYPATVVFSNQPHALQPWQWRARFWDHEGGIERELLNRGFHAVLLATDDCYGSPGEMAVWDKFYDFLVGKLGFYHRVVLNGMSRGGLPVYSWAKRHPDRVAAVYTDAPVCDFRTWPLGLDGSPGSPPDARMLLSAYNLTPEQALNYADMPFDHMAAMAKAGVPVLNVYGDIDQVVRPDTNCLILAKRYRELGGNLRLIVKPGCDHHPHSLKDPGIIADFMEMHSVGRSRFITPRSGWANAARKFAQGSGRAAFLGGSITEMDGYRKLTESILQKMFPQCRFDFINAGKSSTCSDTGAFRLARDVFRHGQIDLLFVEFAVNDNQDGNFTFRRSRRAMEGIVRQAKRHNPKIDIVFLYSANEKYLDCFHAGVRQKPLGDYAFEANYDNVSYEIKDPLQISAHQSVAEHYQTASVNFAGEVAQRMAHNEFDWTTFGGCHPLPFGAQIYAEMIQCFLHAANQSASVAVSPALDQFSLDRVNIIDIDAAVPGPGWQTGTPDWAAIPGNKRSRYTSRPALAADTVGASLSLSFAGFAVGFFTTAGPDAGVIEFRIDNNEWKTIDLCHQYSQNLHYPYTVMLADELTCQAHLLELRIAPPPPGRGSAVRIFHFVTADH